nr:thiamine pyrophosphate-binding protein [Bacilli bacterium]
MIKLSDYVMRFIEDLGVRHVFFLPGGGAMHLVDSLGKSEILEHISLLNEQAVGIASQAYAEYTNNFGVALVTSGPGATNAITGLTGAWLDSVPCMYISGQVKRSDLKGDSGVRQKGAQEVDIVTMVQSVTKYAVTITDPLMIKYHMEKAVHLAKNGRSGPVWIDIPLDVQATIINENELIGYDVSSETTNVTVSLENEIKTIIERLNTANRPCLLIGNGVRLAHAENELYQLVEALQVPILTTWKAMDLFDHNDALFFGRPGIVAQRGANFIQQNSDFLLVLGSRLSVQNVAYNEGNFAKNAMKVLVDIDRNELNKMKGIDLRIEANALDFIKEFLRQLLHVEKKDRSAWFDYCHSMKRSYPLLAEYTLSEKYVNMYVLMDVLSDQLNNVDIVVPDSGGNPSGLTLVTWRVKKGQRVIFNLGLGSMGFGLPTSIAVSLASERSRVVSINGDGGFQLNIQELEAVKRLDLPIKYFILNNDGYASIKSSQDNHFGRNVGCNELSGLTLPNIRDLAMAYGIPFFVIQTNDQVSELVQQVLATSGPVICDVMIDPKEELLPKVASKQLPDGKMASSKLEDLFPFLPEEEVRKNMSISEEFK